MSRSELPVIESVSGGSHGVEAGYDQMLALADRYERHAAHVAAMAGLGVRIMADGDLLESSVLSPASFVQAEVQVLDATTGADGLAVRAVGIEADALAVRAVVTAFRAGDALSRHATEMIDHSLGRVVAPVLPGLLVTGGLAYAYWATLSPQEQEALAEQLGDEVGGLLHEHPELAQHLVNGGGGLLGSLVPGVGLLAPGDGPIGQPTTNDAARLMALLLGNDSAVVVDEVDNIVPSPRQSRAPASLEDLVLALADTSAIGRADPEHHGAIQVQRIVDDGRERFVVYLPGTDDMSPIPRSGDQARDMESNYQLIGGLDSAYGRGVQQAMLDAGLEGKDVMLVGHSQGGMVSTSLAADPDFAKHFNVQHVVTAGSPTAQVPDLPSSTSAIHFENRGDAVPLLDGEDNPDQPNRTTVKFDEGASQIGDNHAIKHYANGAAAADASTNGSIQDQIRQMQQDGYLGHGTVESVSTYQVTRG